MSRISGMNPVNNDEYNGENVIEYASDSSGYIEEGEDLELGFNINQNIAKVISLFQCQQCNFASTNFKVIYDHYVDTHASNNLQGGGEEILVCSICNEHFLTIDNIRNHMINDHGCRPRSQGEAEEKGTDLNFQKDSNNVEDSDASDDDDGFKPIFFQELKTRLRTPFVHKCQKKGCFYKFDSKEKQKLHETCHSSENSIDQSRDFKCYECGEEFKNWRLCGSHLWNEHKIDVDLLKCPFCKYKAFMSVKIWRHIKVHGKRRLKKTTKAQTSAKEKKDNSTNRWYSQKTCDVCGRIFANSKTLSKHVKTVHNKIKPFICNVCGRKSARKITWMVHMRQHTGEKPLQCKYCSYRASDPSVLRKHEMRHSRMRQYKCRSCKYTSIQSSAYKAHVRAYHPEDFKELSCGQCKFVSVSTEMLAKHKQDHKKGLIKNEDSWEGNVISSNSTIKEITASAKPIGNIEISSDCFLPLESTDSIVNDPSIDTGGVTIPAHSEDTQFPNFITH